MSEDGEKAGRSVSVAVVFEAALGIVALVLGYLFGFYPIDYIDHGDLWDYAIGIIATIPMVIVFLGLSRLPLRAFTRIREQLDTILLPMFRHLRVHEIALISILAGWGEELLFRGFLQPLAEHHTSTTTALILTNIVFALAHMITPTYAILAGMLGLFLGLLQVYTDNLIAPIIAHALYDFIALTYYLKFQIRSP